MTNRKNNLRNQITLFKAVYACIEAMQPDNDLFLMFNLLYYKIKEMSFKTRPQSDRKRAAKRKWDEGNTAIDSVGFCLIKVFSISGDELDKGEFGLTGTFSSVDLH